MRSRRLAVGLALGLALPLLVAACGWDPRRPLERQSPEVDKALSERDAGQAVRANERLSAYLRAVACDGGTISLGAEDASAATFDLALTLFDLAERYGRRLDDPLPKRDEPIAQEDKRTARLRGDDLDCARALLDALVARDLPPELLARALYLRGNVAFLDRDYEKAIIDYEKALVILPGLAPDAGDPLGADAAFNRALALRLLEDQKDRDQQGKDGGTDAPEDAPRQPDGGSDGDGGEGPSDGGDDGGRDAEPDAPPDDAGAHDTPRDAGAPRPDGGAGEKPDDDPKSPKPTTEPPRRDRAQDERMLDQFEEAPMFQREQSRRGSAERRPAHLDK